MEHIRFLAMRSEMCVMLREAARASAALLVSAAAVGVGANKEEAVQKVTAALAPEVRRTRGCNQHIDSFVNRSRLC